MNRLLKPSSRSALLAVCIQDIVEYQCIQHIV